MSKSTFFMTPHLNLPSSDLSLATNHNLPNTNTVIAQVPRSNPAILSARNDFYKPRVQTPLNSNDNSRILPLLNQLCSQELMIVVGGVGYYSSYLEVPRCRYECYNLYNLRPRHEAELLKYWWMEQTQHFKTSNPNHWFSEYWYSKLTVKTVAWIAPTQASSNDSFPFVEFFDSDNKIFPLQQWILN